MVVTNECMGRTARMLSAAQSPRGHMPSARAVQHALLQALAISNANNGGEYRVHAISYALAAPAATRGAAGAPCQCWLVRHDTHATKCGEFVRELVIRTSDEHLRVRAAG